MSRKILVQSNLGREGRNLLITDGRREGTVVIDCNVCTLKYASFWNGNICITTIDLIDGRSDVHIPLKYFNVGSIDAADEVN